MGNIIKFLNQNWILYVILGILSVIVLFTIGRLCGIAIAQIVYYIKN